MRTPEPLRNPKEVAAILGVGRETATRLMSSQLIRSRDIASPGASRRQWRTTDSAIADYQATAEPTPKCDSARTYGVLRPAAGRYPVGMSYSDYRNQSPQ